MKSISAIMFSLFRNLRAIPLIVLTVVGLSAPSLRADVVYFSSIKSDGASIRAGWTDYDMASSGNYHTAAPGNIGATKSRYTRNSTSNQSWGQIVWAGDSDGSVRPAGGAYAVYDLATAHWEATYISGNVVQSVTYINCGGNASTTGAFAKQATDDWQLIGQLWLDGAADAPTIRFNYLSGSYGASATSWYFDNFKLTLLTNDLGETLYAAHIDTQPTPSTTLDPGAPYSISVGAGNTTSPTYQWRKDIGAGPQDLPGQTSASLSINPVAGADAGTYSCVVSSTYGTATSSNAVLIINGQTWNGGGSDNLWSDGANWGGTAPVPGNNVTFAGATRLAPDMNINSMSVGNIAFNSDAGAFTLGSTSAKTLTVNGAITQNSTNLQTISLPISLNAPVVVLSLSGDIKISSAISDTGAGFGLTKQGTGKLTLSGVNTYRGGATLGAGELAINSTTALGDAAGAFTINGGTIDNTSAGAIALANNNPQNWNGDFTFAGTTNLDLGTGAVAMNASRIVTVNGGSLTVGGAISGAGFGLTKAGAGTLALGGANTYSGGTTLTNGTLAINNAAALGDPAGAFTIYGGTIDNTSSGPIRVNDNPQKWNGDFTFAGTQDLDLGAGNVAVSAFRQITVSAGNLAVGGQISGVGLIKAGAGTLTLSGYNAYTNATTVRAGVLAVTAFGALPASSLISVSSKAAVQVNTSVTPGPLALNGMGVSNDGALRNTTGDNTWPGAVTVDGGGATISADSGSLTLSGGINALGAPLTVSGAGNVTISSVFSDNAATYGASGSGLLGAYYYGGTDFTGLNKVQVDSTVNFNWGTGSPATTSDPGKALVCNGTATGYGAAIPAAQGSLSAPYTVECWAKPGNTTAAMSMLGSRVGASPSTFDMKFMPGRIHGDIGTGAAWLTTAADANFAYNANTWYHIAYAVTSTGYSIYANGNLIGSGTYASATPVLCSSTATLFIGQYGSGEYFNGNLDEVRIWNTARSQADIQANMAKSLAGNESGLVGYWKCDDGSGTTLTNAVAAGASGTLASATGWADSGAFFEDNFSIGWAGQVRPDSTETYTFYTDADDGTRLWVNGQLLIDHWVSGGLTTQSGNLSLVAGTKYDIRLDYYENAGNAQCALSWSSPSAHPAKTVIPSSALFYNGGGLIKTGSGIVTLSVSNTYGGGTIVAGGVLVASSDGSLGSGNVTVNNNATLELDNTSATAHMSSSADLLLQGTNPAVVLNSSGTEYIHALSFDGGATYQIPGTYGPVGSTATHQTNLFTGWGGVFNVTAGPSATALASSVNPAVYGNSVTFTSTITGSGTTPSGTVTFKDGTSVIGTAALNAFGVATLTVNNLSPTASPHSITAVYGGATNYAHSSSSALSQAITARPITVTAATDTRPYDGTTNSTGAPAITSGSLAPNDTAVWTQSFDSPNVGSRTLTPAGTVNDGHGGLNYAVTFATASGSITTISSISLLTSSENPSGLTSDVTFTATVSAAYGTPSGNVVFLTNGTPFRTNALNGSGQAQASTDALPVGTNAIAAQYAAQANWRASSDSLSQVVTNTGAVCSQTNRILSIVNNGSGSFTLTFLGTPQAQYYVVASPNVTAGMNTWTPLAGSTNTAPSPSGQWSVIVTNAAPRYYRSKAVNSCP